MRIRQVIGDYFLLPRWERWAVLLLIGINVTLITAFSFIEDRKAIPANAPVLEKEYEQLTLKEASAKKESPKIANQGGSLQAFDPNEVTPDQLQQMGCNRRLSQQWVNYLNKGGAFRKPEDLKRLYGMTDHEYSRLLPYVVIATPPRSNNTRTQIEKPASLKEINIADSAAWVSVKGVGPYLAGKIIRYRNLLGGFVSVDQLAEVRGMRPENLDRIREQVICNQSVLPIAINQVADEKTLSKHPYFRKGVAQLLLAYREKHGPFQSIEDVQKCQGITAEQMRMIAPYLDFRTP